MAGRQVGAILEAAHRKGRPMFVAITSDGSVSSRGAGGAADRFDFAADSGARGASICLAIGAAAAPEMNFHQIGSFALSGAVDTEYLATANSPRIQAMAIAMQFANFAGKTGDMIKIMKEAGQDNPFEGQDKQFAAFAPKKG